MLSYGKTAWIKLVEVGSTTQASITALMNSTNHERMSKAYGECQPYAFGFLHKLLPSLNSAGFSFPMVTYANHDHFSYLLFDLKPGDFSSDLQVGVGLTKQDLSLVRLPTVPLALETPRGAFKYEFVTNTDLSSFEGIELLINAIPKIDRVTLALNNGPANPQELGKWSLQLKKAPRDPSKPERPHMMRARISKGFSPFSRRRGLTPFSLQLSFFKDNNEAVWLDTSPLVTVLGRKINLQGKRVVYTEKDCFLAVNKGQLEKVKRALTAHNLKVNDGY